jgi:S-adenosylmethionine:tRNA ribosyltransferase-isomerase
MNLEEYDFDLPEELIAQRPIKPKDHSKMLVAYSNKEDIKDRHFYDIIDFLNEGDVIVVNESKVLKTRISGRKDTGSKVEVIITKKITSKKYETRIKGKKINNAGKLIFDNGLEAKVIEQVSDRFIIEFDNEVDMNNIEKAILPTPPYINEKLEEDNEYQTVYANKKGSLAAPTAGLHFTDELLEKIKQKGVRIVKVCLHVSFGTFTNIRTNDFTKHKLEPEHIEITQETADAINNRKGKLFVVGTTTLKALETAKDTKGKIKAIKKESELFIYPGHEFNIIPDGFITNFHFPKSTLILLVSALYGKDKIWSIYKHAIKNKYRFYSLGDCMLVLNDSKN